MIQKCIPSSDGKNTLAKHAQLGVNQDMLGVVVKSPRSRTEFAGPEYGDREMDGGVDTCSKD